MWNRIFDSFMQDLFRVGCIEVGLADGTARRYGPAAEPEVSVRLMRPDLPGRICRNPHLAVAEAYMDGDLVIGDDDLAGFLELVIRNMALSPGHWVQKPLDVSLQLLRRLQQWNPIGKAQKNVAHHYDLSAELYALFLDADRQYSCAYFRAPDDTLEEAQAQKKAHIARKLLIEPGMTVLDIGCGWGGMGLTLARDFGARVIGVTLSKEQHAIAVERARAAGLTDRVEFRLQDYRLVPEKFDRIVSVGMFEHVGVPHYREYFRHVHDMLAPDGVALIHTIGRSSPPGATSPFIEKYIFPGGYVPALSEVMSAVEREDLFLADLEVWRLHYAETLRHWHARFVANRDKVLAIYDERFYRMWRYYLLGSELTFRHNHQVVFQLQISRKVDAVPVTRDYLYAPPEPAAVPQRRSRAAG